MTAVPLPLIRFNSRAREGATKNGWTGFPGILVSTHAPVRARQVGVHGFEVGSVFQLTRP